MKKISLFILTTVVLLWALYFSGVNLSFLGLRSAILSEENCNSSLLASNKAEYTKSVADLVVINNYITLNACEGNGFGKTNFEIAACERKITLKKNKTDFVNGYAACQASVDAGPNIRVGSVTNTTLIEQAEGENTHFNEWVYTLTLRAQGEAYVRELVYELTLPLTNNELGVTITKADLSSSKTGTYACAQTLAPTQPDPTKQIILITCRSTDGGYQVGLNGDTTAFTTKLNLYVSTISNTGSGTLKFLSGKYALERIGGVEKPFTKISAAVQPGTVSYTMAYVDTRDLTAEIVAQENTSSPTIPVQVVFNKLIHIPSISFSSTDFKLSNNVNASNYKCFNTPDSEGSLRTICSFDLTPKNQAVAADITVDFPAGAAQDKTKPTPKNNSAAATKTIHYVYGAPTIFVWAPCGEWEVSCSGIDNTPQLIAQAAVGDIPANTSVKLYRNANCDASDLVQTMMTTRNMPKVDLYENTALEKNESRIYSVKVGNNCSSGRPTASGKQAEYRYTGETYAQVARLSCMNAAIIQPTQLPVSPYVANTISLCDAVDLVDAKKCNAWQGNATFNPECFPTGQGTIQNPYRICTAEQLQEMNNGTYDKKHYRLGRSIDLTNSASWFGGKWFNPIGRDIYAGFSGSLDGNGFEIQNLTIKSPEDYVGLFGAAQGASYAGVWIHNLKLNNVLIQDPGNISGSLAGMLGCAVVDGVEIVNMDMQWVKNSSGGIAGYTWYDTKILNSKVQWSISTADTAAISAIGGIAGYTPGGPLELGYTESDVIINAKAGNVWGLGGHLYGGNTPATNLFVHHNVIKGSITIRDGSAGAIGGAFGNATYVRAENNTTDAGNNQIMIEGDGTVGYVGWFAGMAGSCDFNNNSTAYSIQWNTSGYIGGFIGSMGYGSASKNSASGNIGGDNGTGPRSLLIGGFVGAANYGKLYDNYSTWEISLSQDAAAAYVGGFAGGVGGGELRRNYSTGNVFVNHIGDYFVGGFAGPSDTYGNTPYIMTDNFSTGRYIDTVGIGGVSPDYYGGFVATTNKTSNDVFENNFFYNATVNTCTGKISPAKPACTSVTNKSAFYTSTQDVYTRANNSWDFTNTWKEVPGGLPVLR